MDGGTHRAGRRGVHGQDPQHRLPKRGDAVRVGRSQPSTPSPSPISILRWPIVRHAIGAGVESVPTWQEITASDDIDVVDICTPNDNSRRHRPRRARARQARAVREAVGARWRQCPPALRGRTSTAIASRRSASSTASGRRSPWPQADRRRRARRDPHGTGPVPARLQRQSRRADELAVRQGAGRARARSATSVRTASTCCNISPVRSRRSPLACRRSSTSDAVSTATWSTSPSTTRPRSSPTSRAARAEPSSPRGPAPATSATSASK